MASSTKLNGILLVDSTGGQAAAHSTAAANWTAVGGRAFMAVDACLARYRSLTSWMCLPAGHMTDSWLSDRRASSYSESRSSGAAASWVILPLRAAAASVVSLARGLASACPRLRVPTLAALICFFSSSVEDEDVRRPTGVVELDCAGSGQQLMDVRRDTA